MNRLRRVLTSLILALAAAPAWAQPPDDLVRRPRLQTAPAAGAPAPAGVGGTVQQQTRPFYLQGAVVVLLSGGAIWAVCHASRRS
jgi:hypothetical protein